jgi:phosphoribosyl 1,2-cyclic phosphodiesterase/CheY-like chemotaxis protein
MKKIVVVDDDADMRSLIVDILGGTYQVLTASDGVEGLELTKRERPELVILDLLMPRMHGFEVCKKIREDSRLAGTKVLISSSKSYLNDVRTAVGAGADSYIIKPYDASTLVSKVEEVMNAAPLSTRIDLQFWGTRGSIATPGPDTQRYGGNTPCTCLRINGKILIIDAGTGLRALGNSLMAEFQAKPIEAHIFVGHTHWDHIQGFPFFTPFYLPNSHFTVYGVHGTTQTFEQVLAGQMHPTYFPIPMKDMASRLNVIQLTGPVQIDDIKVSWHYLNHPGITVGFRIELKDKTICYISDHEPYARLNSKGEFSAKEDEAVAKFVEGTDLLISEAQYTEEEYKYKKSWGHSTFQDVIGLAVKAKAKQLALFHHDPAHTDDMMDRYVAECREFIAHNGHKLTCFGAQEGMKLSL